MRYFLILFLVMSCHLIFAQKEERKNLKEGNILYNKGEYLQAEETYRKALEINSKSVKSYYNIGNSLYRQLKPEANKQISDAEKNKILDAIDQYKTVTSLSQDKKEKAMAWHNIGNIFMLSGDYAKSVEAYKNSLLNNPSDDETRYNYVLAKKLLKDQQNSPPKDNQQSQNQKDKENQNNQGNDGQQPPPESQERGKMSKENAEQILNAIMQKEQQTQERKQTQKKIPPKNRPEKDW